MRWLLLSVYIPSPPHSIYSVIVTTFLPKKIKLHFFLPACFSRLALVAEQFSSFFMKWRGKKRRKTALNLLKKCITHIINIIKMSHEQKIDGNVQNAVCLPTSENRWHWLKTLTLQRNKKNNREREIVFSQRRWKMNLSLQSHSVLKFWFVQIVTNSFRVYFLVSCFSFIFSHLISYFEIVFILFRFYLCDVFLAVCARFSACFTSVKANFPSPKLIIFS